MGAVDPGSTLETCLHISCPKVGLQLLTGEEWMALTPRVPGSPFHILEAGVRDVQLNLPAAGLPQSASTSEQNSLVPVWTQDGSTGGLAGQLQTSVHQRVWLCTIPYYCAAVRWHPHTCTTPISRVLAVLL